MTTTQNASEQTSYFSSTPRRGPITLLLDLFSSVRFGVVLLTILFIYCSIGSAGIIYPALGEGGWNPFDPSLWRHDMLRQWRAFELTEFEWFHTPFFNALVMLICLNIIITTIRRIRLNALTVGVWMIHSGIIILAVGSFIYFGTKFEGDAPVIRRAVRVEIPGVPPTSILALPGNAAEVDTKEGRYRVSVASIDPQWELRSEGDEGKFAYAVSLNIETPMSSFVRQLLDGYPQYTEDVIPGKGRVKKLPEFEGRALVDDSIVLALEPAPQRHMWIKDSAAILSRRVGEPDWVQRRIKGLPRYNDSIGSLSDVWPYVPDRGEPPLEPHTLHIDVPAGGEATAAADPLAGLSVTITGFLRYAVMQTGIAPGGGTLNPAIDVSLGIVGGASQQELLLALDESRKFALGGAVSFDWITDPADLDRYTAAATRTLTLRVPGAAFESVVTFTEEDLAAERPFTPLGETGWQYRVLECRDRLPLNDRRFVTLLLLDLINPEGQSIRRWVFEDPARNRDNLQTADHEPHKTAAPDARIETLYNPGFVSSSVNLVAGPGDIGLHLIHTDAQGARVRRPVTPGEPLALSDSLELVVRRYMTDAREIERPWIVPKRSRDRDSDLSQTFAMVRVALAKDQWREERWIPFHRYVFDGVADSVGALARYEPALIRLPDGTPIELVVGRERRNLPHPVQLDDFILTTQIGGFTGSSLTVRDWTSTVRFHEGDASLSEPLRVSTNNPAAHQGLWFFQAFWDPPRDARAPGEPSSSGLNFTGLGIGNRQGVYTQLFGCCLSVAGMIYAFYIKPIIRRRRKQRVLEDIESGRHARRPYAPSLDDTPIRPEVAREQPGRSQEPRS